MRSHFRIQAFVVGAALGASLLATSFAVAADRSGGATRSDSGPRVRSSVAVSVRSSASSTIAHRALRQLLQLRLFRFLHEDQFDLEPGLSDDPDPTTARDEPPMIDKVPPKQMKGRDQTIRLK